jgi:glycosyltransferase involved in cell wall biosynthesis
MDDKKVLVITNMYPSTEHASFGIFVKNQVEALKKRKLHVDVVAITNPQSGRWTVIKKYLIWGMKTIWILLSKGRNYDVIHAHYVFPSGFLGLLFKWVFHKRLVVTAHGGDIDKMARKNALLFRLTKTILGKADHIIAVGEELQNQLLTTFSIKKKKLSLLNMGVNRHVFKPIDKKEARARCGLDHKDQVILFVGNILEQKGLLELVSSVRVLSQANVRVKLYIIGAEKSPLFKKRLEQKIIDEQVSDRIVFLGVKEQAEIALWMSSADCLVLPSHIEGFGLVALEAMACGTPVIGSEVGGLSYLLADGAGIKTPVKNFKELAINISSGLSSEERRNQLISNGLKKAEENDQERVINRLIDVYFPAGG